MEEQEGGWQNLGGCDARKGGGACVELVSHRHMLGDQACLV